MAERAHAGITTAVRVPPVTVAEEVTAGTGAGCIARIILRLSPALLPGTVPAMAVRAAWAL
jgi:hypothetical protein